MLADAPLPFRPTCVRFRSNVGQSHADYLVPRAPARILEGHVMLVLAAKGRALAITWSRASPETEMQSTSHRAGGKASASNRSICKMR